jgi:hypothetical protein
MERTASALLGGAAVLLAGAPVLLLLVPLGALAGAFVAGLLALVVVFAFSGFVQLETPMVASSASVMKVVVKRRAVQNPFDGCCCLLVEEVIPVNIPLRETESIFKSPVRCETSQRAGGPCR